MLQVGERANGMGPHPLLQSGTRYYAVGVSPSSAYSPSSGLPSVVGWSIPGSCTGSIGGSVTGSIGVGSSGSGTGDDIEVSFVRLSLPRFMQLHHRARIWRIGSVPLIVAGRRSVDL